MRGQQAHQACRLPATQQQATQVCLRTCHPQRLKQCTYKSTHQQLLVLIPRPQTAQRPVPFLGLGVIVALHIVLMSVRSEVHRTWPLVVLYRGLLLERRLLPCQACLLRRTRRPCTQRRLLLAGVASLPAAHNFHVSPRSFVADTLGHM